MLDNNIKEIVNDLIVSEKNIDDVSFEDGHYAAVPVTDLNSARELCSSNVVSADKLRNIQMSTLNTLATYLSSTYGPMASNTTIITGSDASSVKATYSKDGLKVLKNIIFSQPIEMAIQSEIEDVARHVELKVGDGTTSTVILSSYMFEGLKALEEELKVPPRRIVVEFKKCVEAIIDKIADNGRDITIDDIYNICMISTNGNTEISEQICSLYKEYGFDVSIDVGISNDENSKVRVYDGLTIDEGYSDPAYINNPISNTADIHNPRIYTFADPIDTPEMVGFLEKILLDNIFDPIKNEDDPVPTVILAPKITRDASSLMEKLVEILYTYNSQNIVSQKPPVLIVTNITGVDMEIYSDISKLCHCKMIKKYIDFNLQKQHQESGEAPTLENISEWYGSAELVSADLAKTKFINPEAKTTEGDTTYEVLTNFLHTELKESIANNEDKVSIGKIKKRLKALEGNMIDYLIGGITISDRDSLKDLVEDATKNCSSAVLNGVGYAANFEGLRTSYLLASEHKDDNTLEGKIYKIIFKAYYNAVSVLYNSVLSGDNASEDNVKEFIVKSLENQKPYNLIDIFDGGTNIDSIKEGENVLCSIRTDIEILNTISQIITIMVTANQCLLQAPGLSRYY